MEWLQFSKESDHLAVQYSLSLKLKNYFQM